ncbi:MAG: phosphate acetyltransferase, partial [Coriobacteriia bacterium]|nr:phosphate acetyltransferase [Coriobacteriia bacterium]
VESAPWLYGLVALSALSPTIASYVVLKNNREVTGFREWIKKVFDIKEPLRFYLLVALLCAVFIIPQIIMNGLNEEQPLYLALVLIPVALIFGGLEEAGWSYVLRPQLDAKNGLILSSLIIAIIWSAWHIPVLLPQGRIESLPWFGLYALDLLGQSFALGVIMRITKSVWLCVLFHTLTNALSGIVNINKTLPGSLVVAVLFIVVSLGAVYFFERRNEVLSE